MGDSEAPLSLDGLKVSAAGERGGDGSKSMSSRSSKGSVQVEVKLPWYMGITFKDVKAILPTLIILLVGLIIMICVIPYAFSSVFKQLEMEKKINRMREEIDRNQSLSLHHNNVDN